MNIADALNELSELLLDPKLIDDEWRIDVAYNIARIQVAHERINKIAPPPRMQHIHAAVLDATADCSSSVNYLARGLDNLSIDDLNTARMLMESCRTKTDIATALVNDFIASVQGGAATPVPASNANARLRAGPGTNYPVIGSAPRGTRLTILGRNQAGDWLYIQDPAGSQAWIAAFLVDNAPDLASLPVQPAPPLPTAAPTTQPTSAAPASSGCDCSGDLYNCKDFLDPQDAQRCYEHCRSTVGFDVHRLDRDGDGYACEYKP